MTTTLATLSETVLAMPEFMPMCAALERLCVTAGLCESPEREAKLKVKLGNATALSVTFHKALQAKVKAAEVQAEPHYAAELAACLQHVYCQEVGRCFANADRFFRVPTDTLLSQYGVNLALKFHEENCLREKVVLETLVQRYNLRLKERVATLCLTTPEAREAARSLLTAAVRGTA